jgi:polyketide synthase 12
MGRGLAEASPVFAEWIGRCERALEPWTGWRLGEVLRGRGPGMDRAGVVQPALWAVMVSLAETWRAAGVSWDAVVGHSQGEVAAACVAGVLSLEEAARVVAVRSRVLERLAGRGAMVSVGLAPEVVAGQLAGDAVVAVFNGPGSVVVSGDRAVVTGLAARWEREGTRARVIEVDYASHHPAVEALEADLARELGAVRAEPGSVPVYSTVTGEVAGGEEMDGGYWYANARRPVLFDQAVRALLRDGFTVFAEMSPHPVASAAVAGIADAVDVPVAVVAGARREEGAAQAGAGLVGGLAQAWVAGAGVDWPAVLAGSGGARVPLPGYAFDRRRYWLSSRAGRGGGAGRGVDHPLLDSVVEVAGGELVLSGRVSVDEQPWLADHAVFGVVLVPGAVLAELALQAARWAGCGGVDKLSLVGPLALAAGRGREVQVVAGMAGEDGSREVRVHSRAGEGEWELHATGVLGEVAAGGGLAGAWPPAGAEPADLAGAYAVMGAAGFEYGPAFQGLRAAWRDGDAWYAEVEVPGGSPAGGFAVHPVLLDAALHVLLAGGAEPGLPFEWEGVGVSAAGPVTAARARVRVSGPRQVGVELVTPAGDPVVWVRALTARPVTAGQLAAAVRVPAADALYVLGWEPVTGAAEQAGDWVMVGAAPDGPGGGLAPAVPDLAALVSQVGEGRPVPEAVLVPAGPVPDSAEGAREAAGGVLVLVQQWLAAASVADSRLVVLTWGAVAAGEGEAADPLGGAVWGLIRSAQREHPGRLAVVDVGAAASQAAVRAAVAGGYDQAAVRDTRILLPRLERAAGRDVLVPPAGQDWRIATRGGGTLADLAVQPWPEAARPLGPGEVRVAVRAAGVNFRDVTVVMGLVDDERALGGEGAGVVTEVGSSVRGLVPGDRVMGLVEGTGPVAVADADLLAVVPEGWSFAQAASVPVAFLTAWYGLRVLGGLRAGECVLVHAGAGGVGMAAIQLARHLGARVVATASPGKWPVLRSLGLAGEQLASSRSLEFEQRFAGAGIDVVLNSLAGEFTDASMRLLGPGGRFVEMGKTDVRAADQVPAGIRYQAFDLMDATATGIREMWGLLLPLLASGELRPLPVTAWDVREAKAAYRFMSQARHTGKLVLTMPRPLDPEGTVLITGGTGALGSSVARHLVTGHRMRHLLLVSRRGSEAPGAGELVAELRDLGAEVTVASCDVTDPQALASVLGAIPDGHPLTAVVHAAGIAGDAAINNLSPEGLRQVLAAKADAARYLHDLTETLDLSAFVLFSSIAGVTGSPGQSAYAAANAALDALAVQRRRCGLQAVSMIWGPWGTQAQISGMGEGLGQADLARMERAGLAPLGEIQALALFDAALASSRPAVVLAKLRHHLRPDAADVPPVLQELMRASAARLADGPGLEADPGLRQRLASATEADQRAILLHLVRSQAALALGHAGPEAVEATALFNDLGFDSLTAVELRNRLASVAGQRLPAGMIFDYPTPVELVEFLRSLLIPQELSLPDAILADLDKVASSLPVLAGNSDSGRIASRLRDLLRTLESQRPGEAIDFQQATDDELFGALDDQFGGSAE